MQLVQATMLLLAFPSLVSALVGTACAGASIRAVHGTRRSASPRAALLADDPTQLITTLMGSLDAAVSHPLAFLATALSDAAPPGLIESLSTSLPSDIVPLIEARQADLAQQLEHLSSVAAAEVPSLLDYLATLPSIPAELVPLLEERQRELMGQLETVEQLLEQARPPPFPFNLPDALAERDFVGPLLVGVGLATSRTLDWTGGAKVPQVPYPTGRYDPASARAYYAARPWTVARRVFESLAPASGLGLSLLVDYLRGPATLEANARVRAEQLVSALTAMGPTYIKVGQALSIRADLISPPYIAALTGLQDRVPAFPTEEAKAILAAEWGLRDASAVDGLFSSLSAQPVAAASLGQVYKGTLRDGGREVAIKVQRPGVEGGISLDLLLIRSLARAFKALNNLNSDLVGLVDDWGRGFVDELDYTLEARNAAAFTDSMAGTPLAGVVTAPAVLGEYSTRRVLTTEWVDGQRLEKSQAADVSKLCGVALNAYLTMLLSTGLLHCDPHPGNLLRTDDGRLCILDWGLVTRVEEDLQLAFLEHVAHLTAGDYAKVPADLIELGFVPEGQEAAMADNPVVVETLSSVYSQWAGGGGAAKIDVNEVTARLQGLTEEYGNFFQIPPYFAYILRAFSVLEGIALINDPDYSILNECLPYISQRVLTDTSPRSMRALASFVYDAPAAEPAAAAAAAAAGQAEGGASGGTAHAAHAARAPVLDAPRLAKLADGFTSFSASAGGLSLDAEEQLERLAGQVVDLVLSREGSPLQDLLLDEAARLADASARDAISRAGDAVTALPGARALDPLGVAAASKPLLARYDEDERVLAAAATLSEPLLRALPDSSDAWAQLLSAEESSGKLVRSVASKLWGRRADLPLLSARLAGRVLLRGLDRVDHLAKRRQAAEGSAAASATESLVAGVLTGGLATLTTGLLAIAPEAARREQGGAATAPTETNDGAETS